MEIIILIILFCFLRKVPPNTLIIIDRNNHYLKTKRSGFYFLWPSDKVTTTVSKTPITRSLYDYYETDDGKILSATVTCKYQASDLDNVQYSLSNLRRSVDDIIKSAAYFAIGNYTFSQIVKLSNHEFSDKIRDNLKSELESIGVSVIASHVSVTPASISGVPCFKPHVSNSCSGGSASTPHLHNDAIKMNDIYINGPIISK